MVPCNFLRKYFSNGILVACQALRLIYRIAIGSRWESIVPYQVDMSLMVQGDGLFTTTKHTIAVLYQIRLGQITSSTCNYELKTTVSLIRSEEHTSELQSR